MADNLFVLFILFSINLYSARKDSDPRPKYRSVDLRRPKPLPFEDALDRTSMIIIKLRKLFEKKKMIFFILRIWKI